MIHPRRAGAAASLAATLAVLVLAAAAVAPPSRAADTRATSLCSVARGVAQDVVRSASLAANRTLTPTQVKAMYLTIQKNEPALLRASTGSMKANLRKVFLFVNVVITDFKQVNWQPAGMLRFIPSLVPRAKAVAKPVNAVGNYFRHTCKFKNL